MKIKKIIRTGAVMILMVVCLFSTLMYVNFSRLLDIPRVTLMSGTFDLSNKIYEFTFDPPRDARYNIVLKFAREPENDSVDKYRRGYIVNTELRDIEKNLIDRMHIDQDSRIPESWSYREISRDLLSFNAKKNEKFRIIVTFQGGNDLLNKLDKEIYVEKDYDPASFPFWGLFRLVSIGLFLIAFLSFLIVGMFFWQGKVMIRLAVILLTIACILSLISCLYLTYKIMKERVILIAGSFAMADKTYSFNFGGLIKVKYEIFLRCYKERKDISSFQTDKYRVKPDINIELKDINNNLLKSKRFTPNDRLLGLQHRNSFDEYLMDFDAERGKNYKLNITFHIYDDFLNSLEKEIYMEEKYSPSKGSRAFYRLLSLGIFLVTFISLLIKGLMRKRDKCKKVSQMGVRP